MKRGSARKLSLWMVLCMIVSMFMVPGGLPVAKAIGGATAIPEADTYYLNQNFESGNAGVVLLGTTTGDVNAVRANGDESNHYVYMEKNGSSNLKAYASVSSSVDSHYVVVSVDLASTELANTTFVKINGAGGTINAATFGADGTIASNSAGGITPTMSANGEFVTSTVVLNVAAETYSLCGSC